MSADVTIGVVTALAIEGAAMERLVDDVERVVIADDPNTYRVGQVPSSAPGRPHRVALTTLPLDNTRNAAVACTNLIRSFPGVQCIVMTGIAGGVPSPGNPERHVRLGDVVVALHGVIDFRHIDQFDGTERIRRPAEGISMHLVSAVREVQREALIGRRAWERWLDHEDDRFARPADHTDVLYVRNRPVAHPDRSLSGHPVGRPKIHYASVGSADMLLRDEQLRDALAAQYQFVAVEMESAGVAASATQHGIHWFVVRGIADYCNAAKNALWQGYAALASAAYVRAALEACRPFTHTRVSAHGQAPGAAGSGSSATAGTGDAGTPVWSVPRPDPGMAQRPELAMPLVTRLTSTDPMTVGVSTGLYGAGGFGKTTLARQVCADPRVKARFREGVWVTIGEATAGTLLAEKVNDVYYQLTRERPLLTDPEQAGLRLGLLLDKRRDVLLVIDDVWRSEQLRPFLHGGAATCTRLMTTRRPTVLPLPVRDMALKVDQLTDEQARALLVGRYPELGRCELSELVRLAGRWPLLVHLAHGRLVADLRTGVAAGDAVARLTARLRDGGPTVLDLRDETSRDQAAAASIAASMDMLTPTERASFVELGIFAEDTTIPRDVLVLLWGATGGLAMDEVDQLGELLDSLSLVAGYQAGGVRLHDVIRAYLRQHGHDGLVATNGALVDAARTLLPAADAGTAVPSPWWLLPDDAEYLWRHMCRHLHDADRTSELTALVTDLRWVEATLARGSPIAVDIDLATAAGDPTVDMLRRALGQNAHLFGPITPRRGLADTLASRLTSNPALDTVRSTYTATMVGMARLTPRWPLPDQPHPALRRVLTGHIREVVACTAGPDGTWLATASWDDTTRIWDVATGTLRHNLTGHTRYVMACTAGPDGTWVATTSRDGTTRIWDVSTGALWYVLSGHTGAVVACVAGPDGTWLATTGYDRTARIWDVATGALRHVLTGHTGAVVACTAGPDGTWLATTSHDGTARIWDVATGTLRHTLTGHISRVMACSAGPDGTWLATTGYDRTARIWDVATGALRHVLTGHTNWVTACAAGPDGTWLATASYDGTARIWDVATGALRHVLTGHTSYVLACMAGPDGSWLATTSHDRAARIWDVATGTFRHTLTGHTRAVVACTAGPDGSWLATTSHDRTARIWDVATGTLRHTLTGHTNWVTACSTGRDGTWLATASYDGTARVWDVATGALRHTLSGHTNRVVACAVGADGSWLATASHDGTARIWDVVSGVDQHTLTGHTGRVVACAVGPDGTWLVTTSWDRTARVWDVATGALRHTLSGHTNRVMACAVGADGSWLATASHDGTARIWDVATGTLRQTLTGHAGPVVACAVGADGSWLATASHDGTARIWDVASGTLRQTLSGHAGPVVACAVGADGSWLATASHDGTARIWDVATGKPVTAIRVEAPINDCVRIPGSTTVVLAGNAGPYLLTYDPAGRADSRATRVP